jgi:pyruvate kinase|uniref:Uncharacterized protein n=1 Tax=Podoviridae sp. ctBev14 TaxID=2823556 RepID=A0A8S5LAV8_9CAUD|nr:MAG TPA: hypothetical protein [Podoviridae sp. ctBev14]
MKPFNLEEALTGKPVRLRAGHKAFVLCNVNDYFKNNTKPACLAGIRSCTHNDDYYSMLHWDLSGSIHGSDTISDYDIIEMWEEPIKFEDLPKPFKPKENEKYWVIDPDYSKPLQYQAISLNHSSILYGNSFRTEADAQKWLDFMKSQIEE